VKMVTAQTALYKTACRFLLYSVLLSFI